MFLNNKYTKWYNQIIDQAKIREWNKKTAPCYVEGHHYVPKSLGGTKENLVYLTAREHFICHLLLVKMLDGDAKKKMYWALNNMQRRNSYQNNRYFNSKLYEILRNNLISKLNIKQTLEHKEKRLSKVRGRHQSQEAKEKMSKNRPRGFSGKKWFNDGVIETFDLPENKPNDFVFGRLKIEKRWYNNGIRQGYFLINQQPMGWILGMLKRKVA